MSDKVRDKLPEPTQCDHCASFDVAFTENSVVYGKNQGEWPYCWHCKSCNAMVGCHVKTRIPFGRMCQFKTRALRTQAHDAFDHIWQSQLMSRDTAYSHIAKHLGIDRSQCHMAWLTEEQLLSVIEFCKATNWHKLAEVQHRRQAKKAKKEHKRTERVAKHEQRFSAYSARFGRPRRF